jgi:homoserine dehydrogenase
MSIVSVPAVDVPRGRTRTVRVALAGCGVVGGSLVRLIRSGHAEVAARHRIRFELVRVLVRDRHRPRDPTLPHEVLTDDADDFLAAESDLVVEAIGGIQPALRIARAALESGRRYVTANKALVAAYGPRLAALARRRGGRLDFESSVGGGIPVVRALRDSLGLAGIRGVQGVLNGTTNFILTRMAEGRPYAGALAAARAEGFAEADPIRDLDGTDAAEKISILAWLAFGVRPDTLPIRRRGIVPHAERLVRDARALGGAMRLVAECVRTSDGVVASVEPAILQLGSELASIQDEQNLVIVDTERNGRIRLAGPGAGGDPTASALLGDMVRSSLRLRSGAGAVKRAATRDPRTSRWAVSVEGHHEERLRAALRMAGISAAPVRRSGGTGLVVTEPVAWQSIADSIARLEAWGAEPVVSRYEMV